MKQNDILLLGGAALLAYLLFKDNGAFFDSFSGGGGGGGGGPFGIGDINLPIGGGGGGPVTPSASQTSSTRTTNPSPAQSWTGGVTYGTAGQPSVRFLTNTLIQASSPTAPLETVQAAQAARAGAPPRLVAKIKAGQAILDGGKY
jgi:hypothetical protein